MSESDGAAADASTADAMVADAATTDTIVADAETRDVRLPDSGNVDATIADAQAEDAPVDVGGQDAVAPDASNHDASNPDAPSLDASTHDASIPDASTPDMGGELLTVRAVGSGTGRVTSQPRGIDCGPSCTAVYTTGTLVELRPEPAPHNRFLGWGGDCRASGLCSVRMTTSRTVTATFAQGNIWAKSFGGPGYQNLRAVLPISNDLILLGDFERILNLGPSPQTRMTASARDMFMGRLDRDGNHVWSRSFTVEPAGDPLTGGGYVEPHARKMVASTGGIIIGGGFGGTLHFGTLALDSGGVRIENGFLARVDMMGNPVWARRYGSTYAHVIDIGADAATGEIVAAVVSDGPIDLGGGLLPGNSRDVLVVKLTANGQYVWGRRWAVPGRQEASAVATDSAGNIVVAGTFVGSIDFGGGVLRSHGAYDIFLLKLDRAGNHIWSRGFGTTGNSGQDVSQDPNRPVRSHLHVRFS